MKVGGAGGRFPRICGCALLRRAGRGGSRRKGEVTGGSGGGGRGSAVGCRGKLLSCDGDDEVKMADLSKYNPGP